MKRIFYSILILSFIFSFTQKSNGQTILQTRVVAQNFEHPWEIIYGPDNQLWMTERNGKITRVDPITGTKTLLLTITSVVTGGERGLLGMALHPNFNINPTVFVAYTYLLNNNTKLRVARYDYANNALSNPFTIIENIGGNTTHDGCRLFIDSSFKLYITTGDAQNLSAPQNLNNLNGKVLRLNLDGSIPADNPNSSSAVWSSGHRNSQGFVIANGKIYASEHGPDQDDEINIIEKGGNYGWPNVKGLCNEPSETTFCADSNVIEPIAFWTPTIATAGLDYYDNTMIGCCRIPGWGNSLVLTNLKDESMKVLKLNSAGTSVISQFTYFKNQFGRLRDVCFSPDGKGYAITSNGSSFQGGIGDRIVEFFGLTTGLNENKNDLFSIYPNPIKSSEKININFTNNEKYDITLLDINGKIILKNSIQSDPKEPYVLAIPEISKGVYFFQVIGNNSSQTRKVFVD